MLWSDREILGVYGSVFVFLPGFVFDTRRRGIDVHRLKGGIVILLARVRLDVTLVGAEEHAGHTAQAACLVSHVFLPLHYIVVTPDLQDALLCN